MNTDVAIQVGDSVVLTTARFDHPRYGAPLPIGSVGVVEEVDIDPHADVPVATVRFDGWPWWVYHKDVEVQP